MFKKIYWIVLIVGVFSACAASGPKVYQTESNIKPLNPNMARIFFYRPIFWMGSAFKAIIYIDTREVGALPKGSAMFRDIEPGKHLIKTTIGDMQYVLPIKINAGDTKYSRVGSGGGVWSGDFQPVLVEPETALFDMRDLALLD